MKYNVEMDNGTYELDNIDQVLVQGDWLMLLDINHNLIFACSSKFSYSVEHVPEDNTDDES